MTNEESGTQTCDQYILEQYKKLQERNDNLMKQNEELRKDNDFMRGVIDFVNTKCIRQKNYLEESLSFQYTIQFRTSSVDDDTKQKLDALGFRENDGVCDSVLK